MRASMKAESKDCIVYKGKTREGKVVIRAGGKKNKSFLVSRIFVRWRWIGKSFVKNLENFKMLRKKIFRSSTYFIKLEFLSKYKTKVLFGNFRTQNWDSFSRVGFVTLIF